MRIPVPVLLLPLLLAGCALPPIVSVVSLAASGASYAKTGKTTADHVISAFANEDCALLRVVGGKKMCDPNGEVLFAFDRTASEDENWYADPETGVSGPVGTARRSSPADLQAKAEPRRELPAAPKVRGGTATARPVPKPDPAGRGQGPASPATETAVAARGLFADARPSPKPRIPQYADATAPELNPQDPPDTQKTGSRFGRLLDKVGQVVTK